MGERLSPPIIPDRKEFIPPEPSEDLAWMLGVLSGSGLSSEGSRVLMATKKQEILEIYKENWNSLFKTNQELEYIKRKRRNKIRKTMSVGFDNASASSFLGDLSAHEWPVTLRERHKWIYEDKKYITAFISGYFDVKGTLKDSKTDFTHNIRLATPSALGATEIVLFLNTLGIENIHVLKSVTTKGGISGVQIDAWHDIKMFCNKIKSQIPSTENMLDKYRLLPDKYFPFNESDEKIPKPSSDLARLLGILCGGGHINHGTVTISLNKDFYKTYDNLVSKLFDAKSTVDYDKYRTRLTPGYTVRFHSVVITDFLGDLKRENWPETLREKHNWIYNNQRFLTEFIGGFFDIKGKIYDPRNKRDMVELYVSTPQAANELLLILAKLDFTHLTISRVAKKSKVHGVRIQGYSDVKLFTQKIISQVEKKQNIMDLYKSVKTEYVGNPEVLEAYELVMKLHKELGLGQRTLIKHPLLRKYKWLNQGRINSWLYQGIQPSRNLKYLKEIFYNHSVDSEEEK